MSQQDTNILTTKKNTFDRILADYVKEVCQVIENYQRREFNCDSRICLKKEFLRHYGCSADLARKIISGNITETKTMIHTLDFMEDILNLYDPGIIEQGREELLTSKKSFYRKYVISLDLTKPILQKGRVSDSSNK